jgi:glycosyltransferase involved in cell wall biosynthesis
MKQKNNTVCVLLIGNINYDARVQKFIKSLQKLDFNILLILWNRERIKYQNDNINIIELNMSKNTVPANPLYSFFLTWKFCFKAAKIIKTIKPEFCHFNDLNTFITMFFIKKDFTKKYVYDAHELFPEAKNSLIKKFVWNVLEKAVVKKANVLIVPEVNRAKYIKKKYRLKQQIAVINNFPEYKNIKVGEETNNPRKVLALTDKKIIVYQGIIGPDRLIEEIIISLQNLPSDFILLLIGICYKNYEKELQSLSAELKVKDRVIFFGKIAPKDMLDTLSFCDVGIAFYRGKTLNDYYCAPNKIFDYIMAGLPIVTNRTPALSMLEKLDSVVMIPQITSESISASIQRAFTQRKNITEDSRKLFTWDNLEFKIREIYKKT